MSQRSKKSLTPDQVVDLWKLFGPPPVLSSESIDAYENRSGKFLSLMNRMWFIVWRLIRDGAPDVEARTPPSCEPQWPSLPERFD